MDKNSKNSKLDSSAIIYGVVLIVFIAFIALALATSGYADVVTVIFTVIALLLLALVPATIASRKGYSFGAFYAFGVFFWLVALIVSLLIQDKNAVSANDLVAYKKLLDQGVITQQEFDKKKQSMLR